jgi:hypothetical protein
MGRKAFLAALFVALPSLSAWAQVGTWTPVNPVGLPAGAYQPVWTGTEVIVIAPQPSAGGRYNPASDTWTPMSTVNAPNAVGTVVWTGTEVIVWAGRAPGGLVNTGARYNPTTDTWTPMSTTNAPVARDFHSAVWTGAVMVVWGGGSATSITLNTGGRYDPIGDTWTSTSTTNAPVATNDQSAVWTGSRMIVFGGTYETIPGSGFGAPTNTGGQYDPLADTWTLTSLTNAPVAGTPGAVWTGTEMIVWDDVGARYNPTTDIWTPISAEFAPSMRSNFASGLIDGRLFIWGGNFNSQLNTGGLYDPTLDRWVITSTSAAPTSGTTGVSIGGSQFFAWGHYSGTTAGAIFHPSPAKETAGGCGLTGLEVTLLLLLATRLFRR